jgi:GDP-mannose 6-dehydrogenase
MVELIERLIGKGYDVRVFDRNVSLANLQGANREYIQREIPHIASTMSDDMESLIESSRVLVIGNGDPEFARIAQLVGPEHTVVDLVRLPKPDNARYEGIAW